MTLLLPVIAVNGTVMSADLAAKIQQMLSQTELHWFQAFCSSQLEIVSNGPNHIQER